MARVVRGIRMATRVGRGTQAAARQLTGENKKRFIDLEHDFDLDLVYLRPELIVMSVPATGRTALAFRSSAPSRSLAASCSASWPRTSTSAA